MDNNIIENNKDIHQNKNKGLLFSLVCVLTLVVAIIGATYAFFQLTATNDNINGSAATVGLDLNIEKIAPNTTTVDNLVPQYGSFINTSINSECSDGNNTVCQVYQLTLSNTGSTSVIISGTIAFGGIENMPHLKWSTGTLTMTETDITSANFITTGTSASVDATSLGESITIATGESGTVYLVVWIEETGDIQNDTGTFTATVTYTSTEGKGITSTITE